MIKLPDLFDNNERFFFHFTKICNKEPWKLFIIKSLFSPGPERNIFCYREIKYFYKRKKNPIQKQQENKGTVKRLDKNSFELIFRTDFKGLCFHAMRYVKDFETSEEIVQEAFLSLWEKRDNIDMAQPVKAYLITTIRNKCLNWLRDNKKFNTDMLHFEEYIPDHEYVSTDKLVEAEILKTINNAIHELPEKCREIFTLSRFGNLKYQEIADQLQISVKTVETQMSKALQHMRIRLKEFISILLIILSTIIN